MRSAPFTIALMTLLAPCVLSAGDPKDVAGTSFFDPAVIGQPVRWRDGVVKYFVDQGALNSQVDNLHAIEMVDAAASLWTKVSTAGVVLTNSGPLPEDVVSSNVVPGPHLFGNPTFARPYSAAPSSSSFPAAVIFDEDGGIIDSLFGAGSADPASCQNDGVFAWLDGIRTDATISHAVILLNGRCATNAGLVAMMQYQLTRAFGRILGLDYAQVNRGTSANGQPDAAFGWPIMDPLSLPPKAQLQLHVSMESFPLFPPPSQEYLRPLQG